jgi:hypothetical protein
MKNRSAVLFAIFTITFVIASQVPSYAEERFGPWVYYAPYYYPPDNLCLACVSSPLDFLPRYESPNPPIPSHDPGPQCPPEPIRKVGPQNSAGFMPPEPGPVYAPRRGRMHGAPRALAPVSSYEPLPGNRSVQQPQPVSSGPQSISPAPAPHRANQPMFRDQGRM